MNDIDKLKHLLHHWIEHNETHARTYSEWASKAASLEEKELAGILAQIADESKKIEELFKKALESI